MSDYDSSPPRQQLRFVPFSPTSSTLTRKRQRLDSSSRPSIPATPTRPVPTLPHSPYRFNSRNEVVDNPGPIPLSLSSSGEDLPRANRFTALPTPEAAMAHALDALEAQSHLVRQGVSAQEQSDKETAGTYKRHFTNYQVWWDGSQSSLKAQNPSHSIIPALPIIPAKVTLFLEYETTRPQKRKRDDGSDSTGTIGIRAIQQVISALEKYRADNAYKYPNVPATQLGLRTDIRIRVFESAGKHNEPQRVKMAHSLKAKGTNADTFTSTDLMKCAGWTLTDFKGPLNIYIGLRDRAMLLTSCSVAFRGDSTRSLLLSDLFMTDVVMNAKGLGEIVPALTLLADNAKHNQSGRTDEHGAFRHRHVELCPVGSIALLLFSYYHVRNSSVPDFAPDFSDVEYGDFGKREWYGIHLFPSGKNHMSEMGYDNHRKRVNLIYEKNGVNISKNLPQNLVRGFQGAVFSLAMSQRTAREEMRVHLLDLDAKMLALAQQLQDVGGSRSRRAATSRTQREPGLYSILLVPFY
ncbi:hypothetical protein B0H16DRAFT_1860573 [Mycena metata]|uniref:Ndc10 domain-containing protein n=1 Tax=Mycena metata TaxID=1033252 RepID=A0AAD7N2F5_9AGAR|nr:hypothetical protein B0H16DRAFT_1860566 [Mycena metata]KAJ7742820.1 hypothetical protein B0H16DRAFT_1860573 [Mycena metata]